MSLIDELHKLMKEKKYTFAYTAKAMNISSTALHLWLNGNYKGNVKKIEEAVSHFIDIEKLREGRINIDFVETSVAQDVFNIAKVCHVENEIGVCCGVAGVGKTFAVKKYAIENPTDFELNISKTAFELLEIMYSPNILYRSVGILLEEFKTCSNEQLNMFEDQVKKEKSERLGKAIDRIEERFGRNKIKVGFTNKNVPNKQGFMTSPTMIY